MKVHVPILAFADDGIQPSVAERSRFGEIEDRIRAEAEGHAIHVAVVTIGEIKSFWLYSADRSWATSLDRTLEAAINDRTVKVTVTDDDEWRAYRALTEVAEAAHRDRQRFNEMGTDVDLTVPRVLRHHLTFATAEGRSAATKMATAIGYHETSNTDRKSTAAELELETDRPVGLDLRALAEQRRVMLMIATAGYGRYDGWDLAASC